MKIVEPFVSVMRQPVEPTAVMRHIEKCGRICYKSEHKAKDDSYAGFIKRIIERGHEAVLEHGNLIIGLGFGDDGGHELAYKWIKGLNAAFNTAYVTPYYRRTSSANMDIISGNVRAWRDILRVCKDMGLGIPDGVHAILKRYGVLFEDVLQGVEVINFGMRARVLFPDELFGEEYKKHVTATCLFVCDRGVSHEIVRHRPASFCQESTRYCNYAKEQFGHEISIIMPKCFAPNSVMYGTFMEAAVMAERYYFDLLNAGATAQEARAVLPNCLKTELAMTATVEEWLHFFKQRCSEAAHPQMREMATQTREHMKIAMPRIGEWL